MKSDKREFRILIANVKAAAAEMAFAAAIFLLFYVRSFVLYVDVINPVGMEECHTGAVAREILKNGLRFPIEQYTPEYYENSIIAGALLSLAPVSLLGLSRLSVEIAPFVLSFATLMIFISLLKKAGYRSGMWYFIVSYFFVSGVFAYNTMDSVGNHVIGVFIGALILRFFYDARLTGSRKSFYALMFISGFGLFAHMGSLLYAGLCAVVCLMFRAAEQERGPRLAAKEKLFGAAFLLIGALPFFIFIKKTGAMNATFLAGVVKRRSYGVEDWGAYAKSSAEQFLFQFDGRAGLAVLYIFLAAMAWVVWKNARKAGVPESKKLLCAIAVVFPVSTMAAVVVFSGGQFTTYYTYLMPVMFLAGAVSISFLIDKLFPEALAVSIAKLVFSAGLMAFLLIGKNAGNYNFSVSRAMDKLVADEEMSFCYWRFGRSFGNYAGFNGDTGEYAEQAKAMCGRFDSKEKADECLWGWSADASGGGFSLDARAAEALGKEKAELMAASIGGWSESILACFNVHKPFIDDCFLGYIERKAIILASISPDVSPAISISCLPEKPEFSGFIEKARRRIRQGADGDGPQDCPKNINSLCVHADAYCAAVEKRIDYCDKSYGSAEERSICRFVFQNVWAAKEAEAQEGY